MYVWPEKKSQHDRYHLFPTVVMDFKRCPYFGRRVKMSKIRVGNQQHHKELFSFLMWIKSRLIEILAIDLENEWIADGKKGSVFSRVWNDVVWCSPTEAGGQYLVELKGFLNQGWTQQKRCRSLCAVCSEPAAPGTATAAAGSTHSRFGSLKFYFFGAC